MNENEIRLQNRYTGVIVFTKNYEDVYRINDMNFIRVYEEVNPERTYLAHRDAFVILDKQQGDA